jgi:hypothetical protein
MTHPSRCKNLKDNHFSKIRRENLQIHKICFLDADGTEEWQYSTAGETS